MREQIYALLMLQGIDEKILQKKNIKKNLPHKIMEIEAAVVKIEKEYLEKKKALKEFQMKMKRKEMDVKTVETKITKHQDELYGGKNSDIKELRQLQSVIESLKRDREAIEEELLIMMDREDELNKEITAIEENLSNKKNYLTKIKKETEQKEKELIRFIEEEEAERDQLVKKINNQELLIRYNILWSEKDGKVVIEIDGSTCGGCNLSLPSDILYHLEKDDGLITCPNCNRILIWKR